MTVDEIEHEAIGTIRQIAAMAGEHAENPGAAMIAILITAYSVTIYELLLASLITRDEALEAVILDFQVIRDRIDEVEAMRVK